MVEVLFFDGTNHRGNIFYWGMISTSLYVQRIVLASHYYIICTGSAFGQPAKGFESFLVSILENRMQVLHETRVYFGSTCKRFEGKKRKKKKREKQGKEVWRTSG